jgi:Na+/melibiose symporter-like transporter
MGAALLGVGDVWAYVLVCAVSGAALGADLALPPAMLADAIEPSQRANTGLYFGVWALVAKFSLALAAGAALPLLGTLGYVPGEPSTAGVLSALYALLPVAFKLVAAWIIWPTLAQNQTMESLS